MLFKKNILVENDLKDKRIYLINGEVLRLFDVSEHNRFLLELWFMLKGMNVVLLFIYQEQIDFQIINGYKSKVKTTEKEILPYLIEKRDSNILQNKQPDYDNLDRFLTKMGVNYFVNNYVSELKNDK